MNKNATNLFLSFLKILLTVYSLYGPVHVTTVLTVAACVRSRVCDVYNDELRPAMHVTAATPARTDPHVGGMGPPVRRSGTRAARNQAHPAPRDTR